MAAATMAPQLVERLDPRTAPKWDARKASCSAKKRVDWWIEKDGTKAVQTEAKWAANSILFDWKMRIYPRYKLCNLSIVNEM